jgi:hypothetical protein
MRHRLTLAALALPQTLLTLAAAWGIRDILTVLGQVYDEPGARSGLLIGTAFISAWFVPSLLATVGLWRRRNWTRWLAFAIDLPVALLMLSEWVFEGDAPDPDEWPIIVVFFVFGLLYALPVTGRLLRRAPAA